MGRFWIRYVGATSAPDPPINILRAPSRLGADREAVRQWSVQRRSSAAILRLGGRVSLSHLPNQFCDLN